MQERFLILMKKSRCTEQVDKKEAKVIGYFVYLNNHLDEHAWGKPASELVEINQETYKPDGGTALQDAIAHTLKKIKEKVTLGQKDAVLVSIITDGEENASKVHGGPAGAFAIKQLS